MCRWFTYWIWSFSTAKFRVVKTTGGRSTPIRTSLLRSSPLHTFVSTVTVHRSAQLSLVSHVYPLLAALPSNADKERPLSPGRSFQHGFQWIKSCSPRYCSFVRFSKFSASGFRKHMNPQCCRIFSDVTEPCVRIGSGLRTLRHPGRQHPVDTSKLQSICPFRSASSRDQLRWIINNHH